MSSGRDWVLPKTWGFLPVQAIPAASAGFVNESGASCSSNELTTEDMNAAMMEASTKPVDAATRASLAQTEARAVAEDSAVGEIFSQWLEQAGNATPSTAVGIHWDDDDLAPPAEAPEPHVPANWLDALGKDYSEPRSDRSDEISAVNSDDNGLYRMFRNVSP
jgi:hypothetical protein